MDNLVKTFQDATDRLQKAVIETPARIKLLNETVSKSDLEVQDLLHLIEIENFNAAEGYNLAFQLKRALIRRRKAKDELDVLFEIKSIFNQNSKLEPHVFGISKTIGRNAMQKSQRTYKVRVRTDLIGRFEQIQKPKGVSE